MGTINVKAEWLGIELGKGALIYDSAINAIPKAKTIDAKDDKECESIEKTKVTRPVTNF
jgi:hypothetical protein